MRSLDSSEWNVPELPSAQDALIVFGWFGSAPPDIVPRPTSKVPESQDAPTVAHSGAFSVELYTAVEPPPPPPQAATVRFTVVVCDRLPDVPARMAKAGSGDECT